MAVTNYMTVNGQIRSEHRSGEAKSRDYVHDHLGNVVAVFQNDWAVAMATYDPYGEFLSSWNMSSYKFTWNGSHGYRQTGLEWSSTYVRARHYSFMDGAWTTRDPLWPQEMPYGYVNGIVMKAWDYSGMNVHPGTRPSGEVSCNKFWNAYIHEYCNACYANPASSPSCRYNCDRMARAYYTACKKPLPKPGVFAPPSGKRGEVAPRRWDELFSSPLPSNTPCITAKKDSCIAADIESLEGDCAYYATTGELPDWYKIKPPNFAPNEGPLIRFSKSACIDCCIYATRGSSYFCSHQRKNCIDYCNTSGQQAAEKNVFKMIEELGGTLMYE